MNRGDSGSLKERRFKTAVFIGRRFVNRRSLDGKKISPKFGA
jgi:hypothetical protein